MSFLFQSILGTSITIQSFLICFAVSLILGAAIMLIYMFCEKRRSSGFLITLALIPAVVQIIIMMVNGNLGAGVAVAGAFGLVRFRSMPGTAKEIAAIFVSLSIGLMTGMGYVALAAVCCGLLLAFFFVLSKAVATDKNKRILTIIIPEALNYTEVFEEPLNEFTKYRQLIAVKTTNMGSLFKVTYEIEMKDANKEKNMIDALRLRNGNLEITLSPYIDGRETL